MWEIQALPCFSRRFVRSLWIYHICSQINKQYEMALAIFSPKEMTATKKPSIHLFLYPQNRTHVCICSKYTHHALNNNHAPVFTNFKNHQLYSQPLQGSLTNFPLWLFPFYIDFWTIMIGSIQRFIGFHSMFENFLVWTQVLLCLSWAGLLRTRKLFLPRINAVAFTDNLSTIDSKAFVNQNWF